MSQRTRLRIVNRSLRNILFPALLVLGGLGLPALALALALDKGPITIGLHTPVTGASSEIGLGAE